MADLTGAGEGALLNYMAGLTDSGDVAALQAIIANIESGTVAGALSVSGAITGGSTLGITGAITGAGITSSAAVQAAAGSGFVVGPSGPKIMSGTGSPESVVTAPVGSQWTDTAATTGAIQWIKATGTGNTGWKVQYGDTGWRDLAAVTLTNGWAVQSSQFKLRRIGDLVEVRAAMAATAASGADIYTLPTGFRPINYEQWFVPSGANNAGRRGFVGSDGVMSINYLVGESYHFTWVYFTTNAWPASLPGT